MPVLCDGNPDAHTLSPGPSSHPQLRQPCKRALFAFIIYHLLAHYTQSILIICRSHICELTYLLKISNPPKSTHVALIWGLQVTCGHAQSSEKLSHPERTFPAEVKQNNTLPFCFCSPSTDKCPFCGLLSAALFTEFLCFFLMISLF